MQQKVTKREGEAILEELFTKLPEHIQDFIAGDDFPHAMEMLEKKYQFSNEESSVLVNEVTSALFLTEPLVEAKENIILALRERLPAEIERIMKDLDEKIFFILRPKNENKKTT